MYELFVRRCTLPEAYHAALLALDRFHDAVPCSDYGTNLKEASVTFAAETPLAEPMISRLTVASPESLEQYCQELLDGILDFEVERGNWDYTYHQRMGSQIEWVIGELRRNAHSRRACVSLRTTEDMTLDSPACLQHIQYFVRGGKLHCKVLFRSNDAAKAAFMNAFALVMLQRKIADELRLPVGSYTHRANSFHVYERDFNMFDGYIKRLQTGAGDELTYNFAGDWREQMEEARAEIARKVQKLKGV